MKDSTRALLLAAAVLVVWVSTPTVIGWLQPDLSKSGQFGDQFGAVNALFSGLAFAGFFYTVFLQQRQLELQRTELELQRGELALQREEMKGSRQELKNQVAMQRALIRATVAQISVASINAGIEADKLDAHSKGQTSMVGAQDQCGSIRAASSALAELANKLESEIPGVG